MADEGFFSKILGLIGLKPGVEDIKKNSLQDNNIKNDKVENDIKGVRYKNIKSSDSNLMIERFPSEGYAEITGDTQIIIKEFETAIFLKNGKTRDFLVSGTITLKSDILPLIGQEIDREGFDSLRSSFPVEIYFVNHKVFSGMKWGIKNPVPVKNNNNQMVSLRAYGDYSIKAGKGDNVPLLINTLKDKNSLNNPDEFLKEIIIKNFTDVAGEILNGKSMDNLNEYRDKIADTMNIRLKDEFSRYGIELDSFFMGNIMVA